MSQFIKFPTSEPVLQSLCYPCRRQAELSQPACRGCRPVAGAGRAPDAPSAMAGCVPPPAARVNAINKYNHFHGPGAGMAGRSCCSIPPCTWKTSARSASLGFSWTQGRCCRLGVHPMSHHCQTCWVLSHPHLFLICCFYASLKAPATGSSYRDLLDKSPGCSSLISRIHK